MVKALDRKNKQVLLKFIDNETGMSSDWWYSWTVLISPKSPAKNPYILLSDATLDELIELANRLHKSLACLYARLAFTTLWNVIPLSSISMTYMGSPQNLGNVLPKILF